MEPPGKKTHLHNGTSSPHFHRFEKRTSDSSTFHRYAPEGESLSTNIGSKSKACLKFFSTSGCPYGEGCHFLHYVPGGVLSLGVSYMAENGSRGSRKDQIAHSISATSQHEQEYSMSGYKTRICKNFETPEGCRFSQKCHFAHGELELRKSNGSEEARIHSPLGLSTNVYIEDRRRRGHRELTPPGLTVAASFGALSNAKVTIEASLAGIIIGKGGVNAKAISRTTGAKIYIKDHASDTNLKNVEMEGSFDQIQQASRMVRELLSQKDITRMKPGVGSLVHKSKLCENFPKGFCTFGDRCHFAHGQRELNQSPSL